MSNASLSDVIFLCRATDDGGITSSVVDVSSIEARNISASGDSGVFGGSCFYFNGNAFITTPISDQSWVNSDFTIDWWEKPDESTSGTRFTTLFCDTYASQAGGLLVGVVDGTAPNFMTFASTTYGGTSNWNLMNSQVSGSNIVNVWTHRAVIREGTNLKFYCNGNLEYTFAIGSTLGYNNSRPFAIGAWAEDFRNTGYTFTGYIDEFRVTRKAVWTSNFTVPSARYTGGEFGEEANIGAGLPSDYQEVEYLQSSGTQYINSGVAFTTSNYDKLKLALDVTFVNNSDVHEVSGTGTTGSNCFYIGNYNGKLAYGDGKTDITTSVAISGRISCAIDAYKKIVSVSGASDIAFTPQSPSTSLNLSIFAFSRTNGTVTAHSATLYSCQIYESETLIRDFVPCYRKSDNVAGLYDKVNGVFYTNAGTGTFTVGPDVVDNVEPVILSVPINFFEAMLRRRLIAVMQKFALIVDGIEYHSGDTITITSSTTVSVIGSGSIHVSVVGAGGGGGGAGNSSTGGGGGSGGLSQDTINVNKGSYSVIVGFRGTAGTNSNAYAPDRATAGSKGGDTSAFGLSATGGYGGSKPSSPFGTGTNGQAGTGTTSNGNTAQTGGTSVYNGYGRGGAGSVRGTTPSSGGSGVCVIVIN